MNQAIIKVASSAGSGKTTAITKLCATSYKNMPLIYAAPTMLLLKQQAKALQELNVDFKEIHQLAVNEPSSVLLSEINSHNYSGVILTTHASLMIALENPTLLRSSLQSWILIIDEETEVVTPRTFNFKDVSDPYEFTRLLDFSNPITVPAIGAAGELKGIAAGNHSSDLYDNFKFKAIARAVMSPVKDYYGELQENDIFGLSVMKPDLLKQFKQVILLAAIFEDTLTNLIWNRVYDITFEEMAEFKPYHDSHAQGYRLDISYLMDKHISASKTKLEQAGVATYIASTVKAAFGKDFIYSCNNELTFSGHGHKNPIIGLLGGEYDKDSDLVPSIAQVPAKSHGSNNYQHFHKAAALAVTQPNKRVATAIGHLIDLPYYEVLSLYRLQTVYQFVSRTSLRVKGSTARVEVIVLDYTVAQQLADYFEGARIFGKVGDLKIAIYEQVQTRPKGLNREAWAAERKWLRRNLNSYEAGTLRPKQVERWNKSAPFWEAGKTANTDEAEA